MSWLGVTKIKLGAGFAFLRDFWDLRTMVRTVIPYQDLGFIENFIGTVKAIHEGDPVKIYQQRLIQLILVIAAIVFTIVLSLPSKSEWTMLILFDFVTILHYPLTLAYELNGLIVLVLCLNEHMYFNVHHEYFFAVLHDIYFAGNRKFIFDSRKPIFEWAKKVLQYYQVFVFILDLFAIYMYLEYLPALLQHHPFESVVGMIGLLSFHIVYIGTMLVLFELAHLGILACTLAFYATICFFIRLDESYKLYIEPPVDRWTSRRLVGYFRCNVYTMKYLFSLNRKFGTLLLFFLVTNVPINCSLLNAILLGRFGGMLTFFSFALYVAQLTAIFALHVTTADFTKKLHAGMNEVMSKYVRMPPGSLWAQLKTALNIQTFKTKKKYGLTYSSFGLISMSAFFKFMFFYSELIMNGFKETAQNPQ